MNCIEGDRNSKKRQETHKKRQTERERLHEKSKVLNKMTKRKKTGKGERKGEMSRENQERKVTETDETQRENIRQSVREREERETRDRASQTDRQTEGGGEIERETDRQRRKAQLKFTAFQAERRRLRRVDWNPHMRCWGVTCFHDVILGTNWDAQWRSKCTCQPYPNVLIDHTRNQWAT